SREPVMSKKRSLRFVATLVGEVGWVAVGYLFVTPGPRAEAGEPKANAKPDREWNDKNKNPTTCPEVKLGKETLEDQIARLPDVTVLEGDPPVAKAAKKQLAARLEQVKLIEAQIQAGAVADNSPFVLKVEAIADMADAAGGAWDKPENVLPWREWQVRELKKLEDLISQRVQAGIEQRRDLYPKLVAERYKAEVALMKLREQMASGASPKTPRPIRER
ncbi:MAG: hypothetical protein ABGY75_10870, partial [Gemmataceae bacterium]